MRPALNVSLVAAVVMLGGGTKATQQTDIAAAHALARTLED